MTEYKKMIPARIRHTRSRDPFDVFFNFEPLAFLDNINRETNALVDKFNSINEDGVQSKCVHGEKEMEVLFALPGIDKKNINLTVEDGNIKVSYEQKEEDEGKTFIQSGEVSHRISDRRFDTDKVEAEYKDGVLKVTIGMKKEAEPKKITVK